MFKQFMMLSLLVMAVSLPALAGPCDPCEAVIEEQAANCACGQTGITMQTRTKNVGGVCDVVTAWANKSSTCAAASSGNNIDIKWASVCPSGYSAIDLQDDSDSLHHLGEVGIDGAVTQMCLKATTNTNVTFTSQWVEATSICPAGMTDSGVTDSDKEIGNATHALGERVDKTNRWRLCIGANAPHSLTLEYKDKFCDLTETMLLTATDSERNVNARGGSPNKALCARLVSPVDPLSCTTP